MSYGNISLSWKQLLIGSFALITAVATATCTITSLATSNYVNALQLQVNVLENRVKELQIAIDGLRRSSGKTHEDKPLETTDMQLSIIFHQPSDHSKVFQFTDVEYSVESKLPQGYRPVLVVRDPLGQYWSWGTSLSGYHSRVQIGIATDNGLQFEIGVLITNVEFPLGQPAQSLPQGILYKAITVTRQ